SFRDELRGDDAGPGPNVLRPTVREREAGYVFATRDTGRATFAEIDYIDPAGRERARVVGGRVLPPRPGSFADAPLARAAHQRGTAVGPAYATRGFDGQRILRASMDVTEARSPQGVLRGQVNLDFVGLDLGSFTVSRSPDVFYLIDGTGHLVARSDA